MMRAEANKYVIVETVSSFVVNALLNYGSAYLLFHKHPLVPVVGKGGMFQDSIGEIFVVVFLSALAALLIARSRRKTGKLPISGLERKAAGNVYLWSLGVAVLFTVVVTAVNAILLRRVFGSAVSLHTELWFKTLLGAVVGGMASFFAIHHALREAGSVSNMR